MRVVVHPAPSCSLEAVINSLNAVFTEAFSTGIVKKPHRCENRSYRTSGVVVGSFVPRLGQEAGECKLTTLASS